MTVGYLGGSLVGEAAGVSTSALALLELVAHTACGGGAGRSSTGFVREATRVTTVTLTALEGVARAGRTAATSGTEGGKVASAIVT